MIDVNQLRKGTSFLEEGQIYKVLDYTHNKTGRGSATIRLSVRNMRTGAIREMTYN
ncbi:MAG: elongation factor P, partial [Anaerolineae bacterium]|nr:elongation factor P [Anaerolineae bacterium]